jgi:2-polyprenyl-6-methoxyphenol hydroxylase-like FAD-dependent oxidoreductase
MPQHNPKILISGSGIAGSVLAFWLLRAYPFAILTIVERAPLLRLTGAGVDIRNSAIDIVKSMGLEAEIRKHTTQERGVHCVDKNGNVAWTLNASGREDMQSVTSEYEIFRGKLAAIFLEPIKDKVEFVFDEMVKTFVQRDDGVHVEFSKVLGRRFADRCYQRHRVTKYLTKDATLPTSQSNQISCKASGWLDGSTVPAAA